MYGILNNNGDLIARFAAPMTLRSNQPVFVSDSLSLKRTASRRPAQRWEITTNLEPLSHSANELMVALVDAGHTNPVKVRFPQNYGVHVKDAKVFTATYTPPASLQELLELRGRAKITLRGELPTGSFFQLAGQNKVYMLMEDLVARSTTTFSAKVFPPINNVVGAPVGLVTGEDVIAEMVLDTESVIGMVYIDGILMDNGTLTLLEVL
jgi:hypothetical protein